MSVLAKEWSRASMMKRSVGQGSGVSGGIGSRAVVRLRIDSSSLVLDISNESSLMVGSVGDNLNPAVGQSHSVLSSYHSVFILDLLLGKICPRVSILVGKWCLKLTFEHG